MRIPIILLCAFILGACATASNPGAMVAELSETTIITEDSPLHENVSVGDISGGKETNPLWTSQVSSEDFAEALRQSFSAHAMLAAETGEYRLDAELVKLKQPFAGFNLTVTSTVNYTLTNIATGDIVLQETVEESHTAKTGEAFMAVKRLQLANEGSIKNNIATLIKLMIERIGQPVTEEADEGAPAEEAGAEGETSA